MHIIFKIVRPSKPRISQNIISFAFTYIHDILQDMNILDYYAEARSSRRTNIDNCTRIWQRIDNSVRRNFYTSDWRKYKQRMLYFLHVIFHECYITNSHNFECIQTYVCIISNVILIINIVDFFKISSCKNFLCRM